MQEGKIKRIALNICKSHKTPNLED